MIRIGFSEYSGFKRRPGQLCVRSLRISNMATATVTITSDPEVETSPQIVSALVTTEGSPSQKHVAAWLPSESSENPEDVQRTLKASHPDAIVSVVTDDSEGSCSRWTELTAPEHPFSVAAAVAVSSRAGVGMKLTRSVSVSTVRKFACALDTMELLGS